MLVSSMYAKVGRNSMTHGDIQFLKEVGIEPCSLGDPSPGSLPPPPPPEATIPKWTEEDEQWLQNLGVMWEQDPEAGFVPPMTLREYLSRFPNGIRTAVGEVASGLGITLSDNGLDDLAQNIVQMFLDFVAADLEDVVALYEFHRSLRPGGFSFPDYMRFRVKACVETVLKLDPPSRRGWGNSL
jgi:hypothetical protein